MNTSLDSCVSYGQCGFSGTTTSVLLALLLAGHHKTYPWTPKVNTVDTINECVVTAYHHSSLQLLWGGISPTVNCRAKGASGARQPGGRAILLEVHPGLPASTEDCYHWDHWSHSNTAPRVRGLNHT